MKDGLLMNVCMISRYGKGPVEFRKVPIPTVGDNDVLVSIHAASVNPIDFKIKDGRFRMFLNSSFRSSWAMIFRERWLR